MENYTLKESERSNDKYFSLPHPKRVDIGGGFNGYAKLWGDKLDVLMKALSNRVLDLEQACLLLSKDNCFLDCFNSVRNRNAQPTLDMLASLFSHLRFHSLDGRMFQTTDVLDSLLEKSVVDSTCSCMFFRPPYPSMFIEFGESRSNSNYLVHDISGEHILEGAYVVELESSDDFVRPLEITLTGSPVGKEGVLDDAVETLVINIKDEGDSLMKTLDDTINSLLLETPNAMPNERKKWLKKGIFHLAKCIMYINTRCANKSENFALTDNMKRYMNLGKMK